MIIVLTQCFPSRIGGIESLVSNLAIGLGKKEYLKLEHPTIIPLMKKLKKTFDPNNILNPDKIVSFKN